MASLAEALATREACCVTTARQPYYIIHVNRAWTQITGWKAADAVGRSANILQGPHTQPQQLEALRAALNAPSPAPITLNLINYTFQGVPFTNTLRIQPIRNCNGTVTNFSAIIESSPVLEPAVVPLGLTVPLQLAEKRAASETASTVSVDEGSPKRRATSRLRRIARTDLSAVLANSEEAIVLTELSRPHRITHVSKAWCEMSGYSMEEVDGATSAILQGAETDRCLIDDMMMSLRRGESSSATVYNYKKGGVKFLNQVQVSPVWEDGKIAQYMGILHEVVES
ncbi:hypothetical protein AB1Y20_016141 [Prymnesium parvum]|uniref:PAS domain-containing protein n=1 Tax=Prymnesium parvum TaxID=97485 RepID=A0AB34K3G2_PRYPA